MLVLSREHFGMNELINELNLYLKRINFRESIFKEFRRNTFFADEISKVFIYHGNLLP